MSSRDAAPKAVIFGCAGPELSRAERDFFAEADPAGFILFQRNCVEPEQVRALVASLKSASGRTDLPILIDQEGGRVQRLKPPHWRAAPAARRFGDLARRDLAAGKRAAWINARLIAAELASLGISVDCAPVLDRPVAGAHAVIGDRAYGDTPALIIELARSAAEGFMAGGVLPVIKHLPGHGRATVDSHEHCPTVTADAATLAASDLPPFQALADLPIGLTAHIVFTAWDAERPATLSPRIIRDIIRGEIGFDGLLLSDDLNMKALGGTLGERASRALAAGCDLALHCNGNLDEMVEVAAATRSLDASGLRRYRAALARRRPAEPVDEAALKIELDRLLDNEAAA
ncbi:MAG TPA: beta-N-acetylhexosaminidase [Aliidongia sp.]|nr:beta-N-acetylhexosaminidase [Aliidongia sp.]